MATTKPFVSPSLTYETLEETLDIKPKRESLCIGIPKEDSFNENRIALTPDAVSVIIANGHEVNVESNAGIGANYTDNDYSEAGAKILFDKKQVFECHWQMYAREKKNVRDFFQMSPTLFLFHSRTVSRGYITIPGKTQIRLVQL